jgi:hypothetical protein
MPPKTKCKECVFLTDKECSLDIKDKIISQYPDIYNEFNFTIEDGSLVINDFLCPVGMSVSEDDNRSKEELAELSITCNTASIYLIYFITEDLEIFENNLKILKQSFVKPVYLSIIKSHGVKLASNDIVALLQKYDVCAWKIHNILQELTYCESVDMVLSTNLGNKDSKHYCIWDNSPIPELYFNTASDILTYLSSRSPIINPFKDEPVHTGCIIPFVFYKNDTNKSCHGNIIMKIFESENHNRFTISIV